VKTGKGVLEGFSPQTLFGFPENLGFSQSVKNLYGFKKLSYLYQLKAYEFRMKTQSKL
jgi:hypothetical protein